MNQSSSRGEWADEAAISPSHAPDWQHSTQLLAAADTDLTTMIVAVDNWDKRHARGDTPYASLD